MLGYLLVVLLQLNDIDHNFDAMNLDPAVQQAIIKNLESSDYQTPYQINHYLPPLKNSDLLQTKRVISASSYMVIDSMSGSVLKQSSSTDKMPIASLTKLMTAIIFLEAGIDFSNEITIEASDNSNISGSHQYIQAGETMTVGDLFYTSLVGSSNNATKALARSTGLDESDFVARMNKKATDLGLLDTSFEEVTGLSPNNTSTVSDYAKIAGHAFKNLTIAEALNRSEYTFKTTTNRYHRISNTNKLLSDNDLQFVGAKTGYIDEAGYTFVCQAIEDGNKIMVVLFNSDSSQSRFDEVKTLINWAFDNYRWL
ncbi:MAG: D-alanyl-D-alanine carboxypeptidase family protein [Candidatus Kerfeldbacteria bacterium]|jgi:serine-type D-Ala-D-Ala endopeptidase (penicillin-binding protein 7)